MVLIVYIAIRKGKQNAECIRHKHDLILPTAHAMNAAKKVSDYNKKHQIDSDMFDAYIMYLSKDNMIIYRITAINANGYEVGRTVWKHNTLNSIDPDDFELLIQYVRK